MPKVRVHAVPIEPPRVFSFKRYCLGVLLLWFPCALCLVDNPPTPGPPSPSWIPYSLFASMFLVACYYLIRYQLAHRAPEPEQLEERPAPPRAPASIPKDATHVGTSLDLDTKAPTPIVLDQALRNRHVYLIGKTRTGKTTLLRTMLEQDIARGSGVGFIDPHGDAATDLLGTIPDERVSDVVYFDPTRKDAPAFNPLQLPYHPAKLTEDVVSVFQLLFGDSWGYRMEHLLRFGVLTLICDREPHTLRDLKRLYLDQGYRERCLASVSNEQLREFWELEFPTMPASAAAPILNKLSAFLAPMSDLERVFSRRRNDLDFGAIMRDGKILVVNLAKGILGDEPSRLLGGLIVAAVQQAALARATVESRERRDFYFYVDEFQNFTVASFESILAESAKYRLNLTLANQTLGQLSTSLQRAIFGNCATLVAFQVSAQDAPVLQREMHRTRLAVRPKESTETLTLDEFRRLQVPLYRRALTADPLLGMPLHERRSFQLRGLATARGTDKDTQQIRTKDMQEQLSLRRDTIRRTLGILTDDVVDVAALQSLFPDYEFRETTFPATDDFVNLPAHHAFIRVGTAENVFPLAPPRPSVSTAARRDLVLSTSARRFADDDEPEPLPTHQPTTYEHDTFTATEDEEDDAAVSPQPRPRP